MKNVLSVDLEDYYQVSAFDSSVGKAEWDVKESRVEQNTDRVLGFFSEAGCKATFFTLGWVGEKFPQLIRRVADAGHEIACHSFAHRQVFNLSPQEFREDTRHAKQVLEDASGQVVRGYRAPSFSITAASAWAFDVLAELGFTYDSSIFPVQHPDYGMPDAPRDPFWVQTPHGPLLEVPMPTIIQNSERAPFGGGAYLRLLPYAYTRWAIRYRNSVEGRPVCVYIHPWEFDPSQPKVSVGMTTRIRHYIGLSSATNKVTRLLHDFEFEPLSSMVESLQACRTSAPSAASQ